MTSLFSLCSEDIDSAVELLESFYIQNTENQKASISFVFSKVLDANNDAVLDKCKAHTPPLHQYQWFSIRDANFHASKKTCKNLAFRGTTALGQSQRDIFVLYLPRGKFIVVAYYCFKVVICTF